MFIFSKDGTNVINTNQTKNIYIDTSRSGSTLYADGIALHQFTTEQEAKIELKRIVDCMIENAPTYQI